MPLLLAEIELISDGPPITAPEGIVYSTQPRTALDSQKNEYVTKGHDDQRIALAELVAYRLATELHIPIPEYAIGRYEPKGQPVFCSRMIAGPRNVLPFLKMAFAANLETLVRIVLLDIWLANPDRNAGNLLARRGQHGADSIEIVAIDFEKSRVLRSDHPLVQVPTMKPRSFWPTDELGDMLRGKLPHPRATTFRAFAAISDPQITHVIDSSLASFGVTVDGWRESVIKALCSRRSALAHLATEVWA